MGNNAEILVERYDNGIGIQWSDPEEEEPCCRLVAKDDEATKVLGDQVFSDVEEIMKRHCVLTVKIKLEYEIIY